MTNPPITLVVCDLDGTLLEADGSLLPDIACVGDWLGRRGVAFTVATGRADELVRPCAQSLAVRLPYITANGATVMGADGPLMSVGTPIAPLRTLLAAAIARGLSVVCTLGGKEYALAPTPWIEHQQVRHGRFRRIQPLDGAFWDDIEVEKVMFEDDVRDGQIAWVETAAAALPGIALTRYQDKAVELVAAGVNKGAALRELAGRTGHDLRSVLAIGDHQNDLEMLAAVGWPAAVGNAIAEVRDAARLVASTSHGRGVLEILHRAFEDRSVEHA